MKHPHPADFETDQEYYEYLNEYELYLFQEEVKRLGADKSILIWITLIISVLAVVMFILLLS